MTGPIGKKIAQLREARGWDQGRLGKLIGVSKPTISRWENDRGYPRGAHLVALAREFGVSVAELTDTPAPPPASGAQSQPSEPDYVNVLIRLLTKEFRGRLLEQSTPASRNETLEHFKRQFRLVAKKHRLELEARRERRAGS